MVHISALAEGGFAQE